MKKTLAIILCLALTLTSTLAVFADDAWKENIGNINLTEMKVTCEGVTVSDGDIKITKGGDFTVYGTLADGMIYINTDEKVKLRLNGVKITNSDGPAIFYDNADKALITIEKGTENYLEDGESYKEDAKAALFSNDDLEIKGGGKLFIKANYKHGIASDDDVLIENGIIEITSKEHGIKANDTLEILGGDISVTSKEGKGIKSDKEILISGGKINLNSLTNEGIESEGGIVITGGELDIKSAGNGINSAKSDNPEALYDIKISGGKINVESGENGIDSYGNIIVSGGEINLGIPVLVDKAPVDCKGKLDITGGKIFLEGTEITDGDVLTVPSTEIPTENVSGKGDRIRVTLDGKELFFNTDPVIKNGTTLVGFRAILEALGANVTWDADVRMAGAEKDGIKIELYIDSVRAYVNGEEKLLLTAPEIIGGSTMIPVRFVSENLGMKVDWNAEEKCVIIVSE